MRLNNVRSSSISFHVQNLLARHLPNNGFAFGLGKEYRPDATAWAVMALDAAGASPEIVKLGCQRLAADQLEDGRVSISPQEPGAFWPTSLAILAWQGSTAQEEPSARAIAFLLKTSGLHWPRKAKSPFGHDTSLKGWPWTENTHSWVEPTSLAVMALKATGYADHERVQEAVRMILDRQLPQGGWNYGNTVVFGRELRPMPDTTGIALTALSGLVSRASVSKSIAYLQTEAARLKAPLSLAWALLGLAAWDSRPEQAEVMIYHCLDRQEIHGPYDTPALSLVVLAYFKTAGLCATSNGRRGKSD